MPTLDPNDGYLTLINTFTVDPAKVDALIKILSEATEHGMRQRPGFISANLHVSLDRTRVANYAQWRSRSDLEAMMSDPAAQAHMRQAAAVATAFDPIYYDLCESHSAAPR